MGFLCGLVGALLGAIIGIVTALFAVAFSSDGNDLGNAFAFLGLAQIGLIVGAILGIVLALKLRRYVRRNWSIKSSRRRTTLVVAGSVLAVPALVIILLWGQQQLRKPPPDQQLLNNFEQHQIAFETLARMKQADKSLSRVDYNWTEPDNPQKIGVPPERIVKYRQLLDIAHCHRGFDTYRDHGTEFHYWGHGSAISDDEDKGYAYLSAPPKETLPNLDECQPDEKNEVQAYRHIEGRWYLYYDYLPG